MVDFSGVHVCKYALPMDPMDKHPKKYVFYIFYLIKFSKNDDLEILGIFLGQEIPSTVGVFVHIGTSPPIDEIQPPTLLLKG